HLLLDDGGAVVRVHDSIVDLEGHQAPVRMAGATGRTNHCARPERDPGKRSDLARRLQELGRPRTIRPWPSPTPTSPSSVSTPSSPGSTTTPTPSTRRSVRTIRSTALPWVRG